MIVRTHCADTEALQRAFAEAILDPARPIPDGFVGPDGKTSARRFAVYRNNVIVGLVEALKLAYPAVLRLVGEAFFTAAARIHAAEHPPTTPMMHEYGAGFPDFLALFEPARPVAYLADVARFERAWLEAYHAAEAVPSAADSFAGLASDAFARLVLHLHPSARVVRSAFPVVSIWRMNVEDGADSLAPDAGRENALLVRPHATVNVHVLSAGAAAFVMMLGAGETVAAAFAAALAEDAQFDLAATLAGLMGNGAIAGWSLRRTDPDSISGKPA